MNDDDLPEFYIEAAQFVVGMHPFPSEAETGRAIEAVRRAILQARSQAFEEAVAALEGLLDEYVANDPERYGVISAIMAIRQHSRKGKSE